MERDAKRHQGEWRGCHNFDNIICDGDTPSTTERRGGLKMGQRYYYYYEVDGSTETHNPSLPTTTACPFLPGQTVNTLDVPSERRTRLKSASMNSLRNADYKTMDPVDRFKAPRLPSLTGSRREFRIAPSLLPKRGTRSVSPGPSWTGTARRFLGFRRSHKRDQETERGRKSNLAEVEDVFSEEQEEDAEARSATPSGSIRSRELSPESLRRFLSDDRPSSSSHAEKAHSFSIPDDIAEEIEDNDDDENFANATPVENSAFTNLSPPPFQRGALSAPPSRHANAPIQQSPVTPGERRGTRPAKLTIPRSHSTLSTTSSSVASAASPKSTISQGLSQFSFFDDSEDDELAPHSALKGDASKRKLRTPITGYSLPRGCADNRKSQSTNRILRSMESSGLVARSEAAAATAVSVEPTIFGLSNVDISLEDLAGEGTWLNDVIRPKAL